MKKICGYIVFGCILLWANVAKAEISDKCPSSFKELADSLTQDIPNYLNRTYIRTGINRHSVIASLPEINPLPTASTDPNLSSPRQVFFTVLSGKMGQPKNQTHPYWLFISQTSNGWRLSMVITRTNNGRPIDVSDGTIANATKTWLRDRCH